MGRSADKKPQQADRLRFYGRRHGRRLRPGQVAHLEQGLTRFGLDADLLSGHADITPIDFFAHQPKDVFLEIGFGGGEHLIARAKEAPEAGFIGAEPFMNGVASLCRHLIENETENTIIWPEDIRLLLPSFKAETLAGIFILFPDPWPKFRHQGRRIIQPSLLNELHRVLRPQGMLLLASDDSVAKTWILAEMMRHAGFTWQATRARDWQTPPPNWPGTRYMAKADRAGRRSAWFLFTRKP